MTIEEQFQTTIPKDPPRRATNKHIDHRLPLRQCNPNTKSPARLDQNQRLEQRQKQRGTKIHVVTDDQVPRTIIDKSKDRMFTTMHFLGEGGFARCYQVQDSKGHLFAAKVVAKASLEQEKYRLKLQSEIITHGLMKHSRIVRFYDCFEDDHNVYLLLELCENKTLAEMLKTRRHFTEPEVRYYIIQLLDACAYMHEHKVVHRDIKLSNVFLDAKMNVKLGDFGLSATLKDPQDRKRTVCGTPNYMAPEILFGDHRHNQRADIWSVGILMYTLLTGQHPFQMKSYNSIYQKIRDNSNRPTYTYPDTIPLSPEAKDLISKLLVNDPDIRLSISHILQHPFIQHPKLPATIPPTALTGPPRLEYLSSDRTLITTLHSALAITLENKTYLIEHRPGQPIQPICWNRHNVFLDRWVDHTLKYGLGYSISDGTMSLLFNDNTTLSTVDQRTYQSITARGATIILQHDIPAHLRRKHHLLTHFIDYMNTKLVRNTMVKGGYGIHLVRYIVTEKAVVFRLSNNVVQFHFFSKPKLYIVEGGKRVIYVDKARRLEMFDLEEAVATGNQELLALLLYARDTLHSQLNA